MNSVIHGFRESFPFFSHHPNWCYFDSASTTLRHEYCHAIARDHCDLLGVNPGKGTYSLSLAARREVELIRGLVAEHFGCISTEEVFFASSSTSGMQTFARLWLSIVNPHDEILICSEDHRCTVEPWIELVRNLARLGVPVTLREYPMDSTGSIDTEALLSRVNANTSLIVLTHAHNLAGTLNDIGSLTRKLPPHVRTILDATQSVGHVPFSFKDLGVSAAVFSAHKCFGLPGAGCLIIDNEWLMQSCFPHFYGKSASTALDMTRDQIEPGSLNLFALLSMKYAIKIQKEIFEYGLDEQARECSEMLHSAITSRPTLTPVFAKGKEARYHVCGTHSFSIENLDAGSVCEFLEQEGFLVRGGVQCVFTQREPQAIRVSMQAYNTPSEVQRLIEQLDVLSEKAATLSNVVGW